MRRPRPDGGPVSLELEHLPGDPVPCAVRLFVHDPALLPDIALLRSALVVRVVPRDEVGHDALPPMSGRHEADRNGLRFTPHLPFVPGLRYRASFAPGPLSWLGRAVTLDFLQPAEPGVPPEVEGIFPSAGELPENLLRFHICFSRPMRRGLAGTEIALLGPDGHEVSDALYRAPVELWDRDMRCLTVLLDPGRLKRGVGPNRALGPPLRAGQVYALAVGKGMAGCSGQPLPAPVFKRFRVTGPVREAITAAGWDVVPPVAGSRQPLLLRFLRPLDWALLRRAITVADAAGQMVPGRVEAGCGETEAAFTPAAPWNAVPHIVSISAALEDVCGNSGDGPFDRPLRDDPGQTGAVAPLTFVVRPRPATTGTATEAR